ncbi:hypothetical protein [Anaerolinea sp.]|uniref:hypothetical protein n=1 Tax=Anaerolinea sp. TaxID=1872519 RepID=UPI002ACEAC54|nr:hypothetical protein [Anaerolinea sp.]
MELLRASVGDLVFQVVELFFSNHADLRNSYYPETAYFMRAFANDQQARAIGYAVKDRRTFTFLNRNGLVLPKTFQFSSYSRVYIQPVTNGRVITIYAPTDHDYLGNLFFIPQSPQDFDNQLRAFLEEHMTIPIPDEVIPIIKEQMSRMKKGIFVNNSGYQISRQKVTDLVSDFYKKEVV